MTNERDKNINKKRPPGHLGGGPDSSKFNNGNQKNEHKRSRTSQRPRPTKTQKEEFKTRD